MEHKNLVNDIWDTSVRSVNEKVLPLCILFLGKLLPLSCAVREPRSCERVTKQRSFPFLPLGFSLPPSSRCLAALLCGEKARKTSGTSYNACETSPKFSGENVGHFLFTCEINDTPFACCLILRTFCLK